MSGWERPTPPPGDDAPPRSYWTLPSEAGKDALGVRQLIKRGWRLYRSAPRRFLLVALVPELIRDLLALPSTLIAGLMMQGMFTVMGDFFRRLATDPRSYQSDDSRAFQAELQAQIRAAIQPHSDLAALASVSSGIGVAVILIGGSALVAAALTAAGDRPISVATAFRIVAGRRGLVQAILALGVSWSAVSLLLYGLEGSTDFQAWAGAPGSPRSVLLGGLLAVVGVVATIGVIVLALRWALLIPALIVESLGLGRGLARSAQLTRGIRIRLGLAMLGIVLLQSLSVGLVAWIVGLAVGLAASSLMAGFAAGAIVTFVGSLLWSPVLPAMLTVAYLERTHNPDPAPPLGSRSR
ncbi:MAG: hypothetical protein QOJ75_34 [Chloroflexota bacterium]|nr:hypothetical protein [Chloroflexota bacterium]